MEESYSEGLSRNLSGLSFTSNASSAFTSSTAHSGTSKQNANHDSTAASSLYSIDSSDGISRENSELSMLRDDSEVLISRENTEVSISKSESTNISLSGDERSNSNSNIKNIVKENSRESSASEFENTSRESSVVPENQSGGYRSAYNSEDDSSRGIGMSRESTMSTTSKVYQDDFEPSFDSYAENDNISSQEESIYDKDEEGVHSTEKEKSVLIERDGKFELVDPSEVEAGAVVMLNGSNKKRKEKGLKSSQRSKSTIRNKNPEYAHVTSEYALTETQVEMKKRQISVRNMRINEEKQRCQDEDEKQRVQNEKSYKKWLVQKSFSVQNKVKVQAGNSMDDERREIAEKSYNQWLKQKELQKRQERKLEKIRIADEAEHYIVRDRVMCEKSFHHWLKQKKFEQKKTKVPATKKQNDSWTTVAKNKPVTCEEKMQSCVSQPIHQLNSKDVQTHKQTLTKLSKRMSKIERMSKIRYCETFGYQHPASYDDLLI